MLKARFILVPKKGQAFIGYMISSRQLFWRTFATFFLLLLSGLALSAPQAPDNAQAAGLYQVAFYVEEDGNPLDINGASQRFKSGDFRDAILPLSLGIGSNPVWIRFDFNNQTPTALSQRLSVQTSWLDQLDVYFLHDGRVAQQYRAGDRFPHAQRPQKNRYFIFDHDFPSGTSEIFIRAETPDPMLLLIYLETIEKAGAAQTLENYGYGFLYGGMLTLLAYNVMIFFSLKSSRHLHYSVYIIAFLVMNMAYTGHGYMWLWPDSPTWQAWSNPLLIVCFSLCGLTFAIRFLNTKESLPKFHRMSVLIGSAFFLAELLAISVGSEVAALWVSFSLVFAVSILLVLLGSVALFKGNRSAKYFLLGSITHVISASVTVMVVWSFIPYSSLAYHAVEIGMMVDAIMLAMALADKFRITQEEKLLAETLSKLDPLTSLSNRRAFYEGVNPIWDVGLRKDRPMSLVLLDVDRFKAINDRLGHALGDEILVLLADLLTEQIRTGDFLARWGGEEFVIFLPETDFITGLIIAERLRGKISSMPLPEKFDDFEVTVSFGVAQNDGGNMSLDELISAADNYLYRAKSGGRDQVCGGLLSEISPQVPWVRTG